MKFTSTRSGLALLIPSTAIVLAGIGVFTHSIRTSEGGDTAPQRATTNAAVSKPTPALGPVAADAKIASLQATLDASLKGKIAEEEITEEEVVSRQAGASSDLAILQSSQLIAESEIAAVSNHDATSDAVTVQDDRLAALTTPHSAAKLFASGQAAEEEAARCKEDLRNLTEQAVVYFSSGGVTTDDGGIEQGRLIGLVAQSCQGVQIRVEGHSDSSGDPAANQRLSERRAQQVIQRIAASGIDTRAFFAEGAGSSKPSRVDGPQPRAFYDRRVEFSLIEDVTPVALSVPVAEKPWANATCVVDLERAVADLSLFYTPRAVSLPGQDLATAIGLAERASACPQARLRIVGHHSDDIQDREDMHTGLLRAKALMAMMLARGISPDQLVIAAPSRAMTDDGLSGSRVKFDVAFDQP